MDPRPDPVLLRAALATDAERIVALVHAAYRGASSRAGWTTEADYLDGGRTDVEEVAGFVADPEGAVLVVDDGPDLLACCHVQRVDPSVADFGLFAVDPGRQASGTGRAVLDGAAWWSGRRWGVARQRISVLGPRADLLAWYERRGFVATGERRPFPTGDPRYGRPKVTGLDLVVMERPLPPDGG